jgi:formiminotetrahydrofolate cyclodeaminase
MGAGLTRKKKSQAARVDQLSEHLDALRREAEALMEAVDADAASYDAVMAAFKLPQGDSTETSHRDEAIQTTTKRAAEVPLKVAQRAVALLERLGQLETIAAASMKSDLQVARLMAEAGARGAIANIEINLDGIKDAAYVAAKRQAITALRNKLSAAPVA